MQAGVIDVSAEDIVDASDRKSRLKAQLGGEQKPPMTTAIARVGEDPIARMVRGMFGYMEKDAEEIARQKKTHVNDTGKRKFESLIVTRIQELRRFVRDKVVPRIEMFTDRLEATQCEEALDKKKDLVLLNRKLEEINTEEQEAMEALKQEIQEKFQKKRQKIQDEKVMLDNDVGRLERDHKQSVKRLKVRLESRLSGFDGFVSQMQTTATEMLWAQCTNLFQVQQLLEKVPSSAGFMGVIADMAVSSNDRALQVLLAGKVEEKQDWFCDKCAKFTVLTEYDHDGQHRRSDGTRDHDAEEYKGKPMFGCANCKSEWLKEDMQSMRCPFRMKQHEIIRITEEDAKGADIWEYLNGGSKANSFGNEDHTITMADDGDGAKTIEAE